MARPDYILDLQSLAGGREPQQPQPRRPARPWLAVHWRCCSVYSRIYRTAEGTRYDGRCPRCAAPVSIRVGEGGTSSRFFEAG